MATIADALRWKLPKAKYVLRGDALAEWHSAEIPQPSPATLAQWASEYEAQGIATTEARAKELTIRGLKAIATATHKRCKRIEDALTAAGITGAAAVTAAQWQAQIEAEWDGQST